MQTEQPTNTSWMEPPPVVSGCPEGLEYLTQLDQILIKQSYEIFEMLSGFETANKYKLKNNMGQTCYVAAEKSGCCTRMCCGPQRPFDMVIKDNDKREVIHLKRPLRCVSPCFFCCLQEVEVTSPVSGETLGYIKQKCHPCLPLFDIQDAEGNSIFEIKGPFCQISCCSDINFPVCDNAGNEVGKISKQWSGVMKEAISDADNFGCTFPLDLDVKIKAVLIGAVFLVDFMYFENKQEDTATGSALDCLT